MADPKKRPLEPAYSWLDLQRKLLDARLVCAVIGLVCCCFAYGIGWYQGKHAAWCAGQGGVVLQDGRCGKVTYIDGGTQ
jgi:hypothetical protein